MSINVKISNLIKRDILCTYCRNKFMIELPKEGIGIKIIKCPFCNRKIQILQNKENITLYTIKKNKDRTWKELLDMCAELGDKICWDYVTALRGPDFVSDDDSVKYVFTCPLRGKVKYPLILDVNKYESLSLEDFEKAFLEVSNNKEEYGHYIFHIEDIWLYLNPKISRILSDLRLLDLDEDSIKKLAHKYKKYMDEWLENEEIIIK